MARVQDPLRMLTAMLIGAGWRTAVLNEGEAVAELRTIGERGPGHLPQAAADAADLWERRADDGLVNIDRAKTAAGRLRQLAVDECGQPVTPKRESSLGGHQIPSLPPASTR